jgi:hypothetical protein
MERTGTAEGVIIEATVQSGHAETEVGEIEYAILLLGRECKCPLALIETFEGRREVMKSLSIPVIIHYFVEGQLAPRPPQTRIWTKKIADQLSFLVCCRRDVDL